ncbi:15512_t:CDS:2, partial [Racocetra fulgida]
MSNQLKGISIQFHLPLDCYRASLRVLSGNKLIDDFIELTQTFRNCTNRKKLEFIPYKQFTNIEYLAKGGFSVIYKATWVDGLITCWNYKKQKFNRKKNYDVVLKILNKSDKMDSDYLNEVSFFHCIKDSLDHSYKNDNIHQYLGITRHPETKNYIIVIEFAQNRDLHYFLNKGKNPLSWIEKLRLLHKISSGLKIVHDHNFINRDLHSGNILINQINIPAIADLGISKPADTSSDEDTVYGVIPYVEPEVLKGGKFTQASDIYSLGMIILEVISGYRPFSDRKHDEHLILDILNGFRPKIPTDIPHELVKLLERCWDPDPKKRTFKDFINFSILGFWEQRRRREMGDLGYELDQLIRKAKSGEIKFPEIIGTSILPTKINEQAIYSSRPLTPLISKALTLQIYYWGEHVKNIIAFLMKFDGNIPIDLNNLREQVENNYKEVEHYHDWLSSLRKLYIRVQERYFDKLNEEMTSEIFISLQNEDEFKTIKTEIRANPFLIQDWSKYRERILRILPGIYQSSLDKRMKENSERILKNQVKIIKGLRKLTYGTANRPLNKIISIWDPLYQYLAICPSYVNPPERDESVYTREFIEKTLLPMLKKEADELRATRVPPPPYLLDIHGALRVGSLR